MKKLLRSLALAATMLVSGCASELGRFPILSTKNVEVSRVDLKKIGVARDLEGTDGRVWFLFIPFGGSPTIEKAADRCLARGYGDFMTSARVEHVSWSILLFTYEGYRVTGDVCNSLGEGGREIEGASR